MTPKRISLSRQKGWRMPDNTISVARPTKFGNPFMVEPDFPAEKAVEYFRRWLEGDAYITDRYPELAPRREKLLRCLPALQGKNLACWCKAGCACHADILLEIANS